MAVLKRMKPCSYSGCPNLTEKRYCSIHKKFEDKDRPSAYSRGYNKQWSDASKAWLNQHPRCVECGAPATLVDHCPAHKGNIVAFWDKKTWRSMCDHCHRIKSIKQDGTLGKMNKSKSDIVKKYRIPPMYRLS